MDVYSFNEEEEEEEEGKEKRKKKKKREGYEFVAKSVRRSNSVREAIKRIKRINRGW